MFPAIAGSSKVEALEALGIVESFSVASLIEGADAAVKAANVQLIEIRLAMALGGKAFVTLTGNVAAVQSAVDAAAQVVGQKGMLVNKVVIPQPAAGIAERNDLDFGRANLRIRLAELAAFSDVPCWPSSEPVREDFFKYKSHFSRVAVSQFPIRQAEG